MVNEKVSISSFLPWKPNLKARPLFYLSPWNRWKRMRKYIEVLTFQWRVPFSVEATRSLHNFTKVGPYSPSSISFNALCISPAANALIQYWMWWKWAVPPMAYSPPASMAGTCSLSCAFPTTYICSVRTLLSHL